MPSRIKPVPLRMPPEVRAAAESFAESQSSSLHAALLTLLRAGMEAVTHPGAAPPRPAAKAAAAAQTKGTAKAVLAQAQEKAAHLAKPPVRRKSRWSLKDVHLGPVERAPGSMLKGPHPKGKLS